MQAALDSRNASKQTVARCNISVLLRRPSYVHQFDKPFRPLPVPTQQQPWLLNEVVVAFAEAGAEAEEVTGVVEALPEGRCLSVKHVLHAYPRPSAHPVCERQRIFCNYSQPALQRQQCAGPRLHHSLSYCASSRPEQAIYHMLCSHATGCLYVQNAAVSNILVSLLTVWASIPVDSSVSSAEAGGEEEVVLVAEEALTRVAEVAVGVEVEAEGVVEAGVVAVA